MSGTFLCALKNLGRKRSRTILTIFSIAIGVMSVTLIAAISAAGKNAVNAELDGLGIGAVTVSADQKISSAALNESKLRMIETLSGVDSATPIMVESSRAAMRGLVADTMIWGIGSGAEQVISLNSLYGDLFSALDIAGNARVCLIDSSVAEAFYHRENIVGKKVRLLLDGVFEEFEVIGIVESGGNILQGIMGDYLPSFVYIPFTSMRELSSKSGFDQIAVKVKREEEAEQVGEKILEVLKQNSPSGGVFRVQNIAQQKDRLNHLLDIVTVILSLIAGISLIVSGLGIMTIMLVSVSERTREIGIKKSIGASRKNILFEFIAEALLISLIGSAAGAGAGCFLAWLGCMAFHMELSVSPVFILTCIFISVVIGVAFSAYPAMSAARLNPVDALRTE